MVRVALTHLREDHRALVDCAHVQRLGGRYLLVEVPSACFEREEWLCTAVGWLAQLKLDKIHELLRLGAAGATLQLGFSRC